VCNSPVLAVMTSWNFWPSTRTINQIDKTCKPLPTTQLTAPLKLRPSILCILALLINGQLAC
jgi:hypothetical protein